MSIKEPLWKVSILKLVSWSFPLNNVSENFQNLKIKQGMMHNEP